jgi:hypothetical protein
MTQEACHKRDECGGFPQREGKTTFLFPEKGFPQFWSHKQMIVMIVRLRLELPVGPNLAKLQNVANETRRAPQQS